MATALREWGDSLSRAIDPDIAPVDAGSRAPTPVDNVAHYIGQNGPDDEGARKKKWSYADITDLVVRFFLPVQMIFRKTNASMDSSR